MTNYIQPKGTARVTVSIPATLRQAMAKLDKQLAKDNKRINWSAVAAEAFAFAIENELVTRTK